MCIRLNRKKPAQSIVEFGLILALVGLIGAITMEHLGDSLKDSFTGFTDKIQNANVRSNSGW